MGYASSKVILGFLTPAMNCATVVSGKVGGGEGERERTELRTKITWNYRYLGSGSRNQPGSKTVPSPDPPSHGPPD